MPPKTEYAAAKKSLVVVACIPPLLERGLVWFQENFQKEKISNPWWLAHSVEFGEGQRIMQSEILRKLADLGYQKVLGVRTPGEYAARGGIIDIFPINEPCALRMEMEGNAIGTISPLAHIANNEPETLLKKLIGKRDDPIISTPLQAGMYVVHIDHGVGKYIGIQKQELMDAPTQYLVIEYAGNDKLYVPEDVAHKVTPYIGFGTPPIYRLGGNLWEKTKRKAQEDIWKTARELAGIYAQRSLAHRHVYEPHEEMEARLAENFPYEETPDQQRTIEEVLADMQRTYPMDRVVCGDVGFGKTEVALRAIARAVFSGRQAILLTPTTVLAWQHFQTLNERFAPFPVRVALLSRTVTPAEQLRALKEFASGQIDIIVGTHRALSKDVHWKDLGLLVVDEEQRFGVRHKERVKQLRAEVDVLSLSATPIPRTLSFALSGLRDISVIHTPPEGRVPIHTTVAPRTDEILQSATSRELARKGQIYILHNRVATIAAAAQKTQDLFPDARIEIAHAKLPDARLISIMQKFREGKIDILVATTIIENGLDIANVNTLIVDDATRLGLSQAHQIRGRIGRGNVQAYAYLLYPDLGLPGSPRKTGPQQPPLGVPGTPSKARERLETLQAMQYLGAGYQIALKDLELRGAGNLLGSDQSGTLNRIGFNLYYQMLQEAVEEIRTQQPIIH